MPDNNTFSGFKIFVDVIRHDFWPRVEMQTVDVFACVALERRIQQSVLVERVGVSDSSISRNLDKLVREGMIVRREDPGDRRSKIYELTDVGDRIGRRLVLALREAAAVIDEMPLQGAAQTLDE